MYRLHGAIHAYGGTTVSARSTADSVISALTPAAWYRNATDVVSSGGFASIWADYASSDKGLVLPGVSGNRASAASAAGLDISADIDVIVKCALYDWTPVDFVDLVTRTANYSAGWAFFLRPTTGYPAIQWADGGGTIQSAIATAAPTVSDGGTTWLRVTLDSNNGAGGSDTKFYESADGVVWTQIGTTVTQAVTGFINEATALTIGAPSVLDLARMNVFRAIVKDGIDGTTVFDADFSSQAIGTASFTESSSNAATVTINASGASPAHIGKARDLLQGTGTNQPAYAAGVFTFDGADNSLKITADAALIQPLSVYIVGSVVSWTGSDAIMDGNTSATAMLYEIGASPNIAIYAGSAQAADNTDLAVGAEGIICAIFNGASSSVRVNNSAKTTGNPGIVSPGGLTIGTRGSAGFGWSNMTAREIVCFLSAHDDATQSSVITALNNALTVF